MDIIKKLNTRSSVKLFDKNKKVSEEDMNTILESLRLAPSSYGLQGWKFVVVSNPDIKKEIETHSNNQKQIADAPDLIVLCYIKDLSENHVDKYIHEISTKRNVPLPELL